MASTQRSASVSCASIIRLVGVMPLVAIGAVLGIAYTLTLAPGVTWANDGADSGDLITAAATLGVAHPTGYPTYLLLSRLFQYLPVGDLALRTTIGSAVAATLAVICLYLLIRDLLVWPAGRMVQRELTRRTSSPPAPLPAGEGSRPRGRVREISHEYTAPSGWWVAPVAGGSALAFGLSPVFWSQAVIAEVYALNALFVAVILRFTLQALTSSSQASSRRQALLVGLALGNHVTFGFAAVPWLVVAVACTPAGMRVRALVTMIVWLLAGLLVYLYLPLRAASHPPINWGDPQTLTGFWWVVSGEPYRNLAFTVASSQITERGAAWANLLVQQFGWVGLILGFVGLLYGAPRTRMWVWMTAAVAVIFSVFALLYNTDDSYAYLIPVFLIFAIWIGLGVDVALRSIFVRVRLVGPCALLILALSLAWHAVQTASHIDASQDRRAITFANTVLATAPVNAIIATSSDLDTFPLWYYHYALAKRPDVVLLVNPLLEFAWYRDNLHFAYPSLHVPTAADADWLSAMTSANGERPFCTTDTDAAMPVTCRRTSVHR